MKQTLALATLIGIIGLMLLPGSAPAQEEWQNRIYAKVDIGGDWTSSTEVTEIFGQPVVPGSRVEFEPGVRFGATFGYNATDWFAGEFELGVMDNSIKSITGAYVDAFFVNVPILVNAKFQLPTRTRFTPYAGIGGGGASSVLDIDHLDYGFTHLWGSASDFVWAWQAFAGVRFAINDRMGLGVEYRYFRSEAPSFDVDYGYYYNIYSDHIKFGDIETQAVSLRFDFVL